MRASLQSSQKNRSQHQLLNAVPSPGQRCLAAYGRRVFSKAGHGGHGIQEQSERKNYRFELVIHLSRMRQQFRPKGFARQSGKATSSAAIAAAWHSPRPGEELIPAAINHDTMAQSRCSRDAAGTAGHLDWETRRPSAVGFGQIGSWIVRRWSRSRGHDGCALAAAASASRVSASHGLAECSPSWLSCRREEAFTQLGRRECLARPARPRGRLRLRRAKGAARRSGQRPLQHHALKLADSLPIGEVVPQSRLTSPASVKDLVDRPVASGLAAGDLADAAQNIVGCQRCGLAVQPQDLIDLLDLAGGNLSLR